MGGLSPICVFTGNSAIGSLISFVSRTSGEHRLHVMLGFGKADIGNEELDVGIRHLGTPAANVVGTAVVGGKRQLGELEFRHQFKPLFRAESDADLRIVKLIRNQSRKTEAFSDRALGFRNELHQAARRSCRLRFGIVFAFLPNHGMQP